ncbi:hypothetical protein GCM10027321_17570 [Massilia terrae]
MHAELVERRRWISERRFLRAAHRHLGRRGRRHRQPIPVLRPQVFFAGGQWQPAAMLICAAACVALFRYRVDTVRLVLACAVAGLVLSYRHG